MASYKGHCQCVQLLLRCGAHVAIHDNVTQRTPVHAAAANGHVECLRMLLDNSETSEVVDALDAHHRTPLMFAAASGSTKCVITLLHHGANFNIADKDNHTALFRAIHSGHSENVEIIVDTGASVVVQVGHLMRGHTILNDFNDSFLVLLLNFQLLSGRLRQDSVSHRSSVRTRNVTSDSYTTLQRKYFRPVR